MMNSIVFALAMFVLQSDTCGTWHGLDVQFVSSEDQFFDTPCERTLIYMQADWLPSANIRLDYPANGHEGKTVMIVNLSSGSLEVSCREPHQEAAKCLIHTRASVKVRSGSSLYLVGIGNRWLQIAPSEGIMHDSFENTTLRRGE